MSAADISAILALVAIYCGVVVSPGPSFALIARLAASGEVRAALAAALGHGLAAVLAAALAMGGLAALLAAEPAARRLLAIAGGLYLVHVGIAVFRGAGCEPTAREPDAALIAGTRETLAGLRLGALVCLTNPKGLAFFAGVFAAAIPAGMALSAKGIVLLAILAVELLWYGGIALLLARGPARAAYRRMRGPIERVVGAGLVAAGIGLAIWS
ncbi:LysE family translocator [Salinarimonas sp.]|uniref:LysE family translocator n=1 Tax=Salinarimonas sp. TaxID=2766526 RepID=UPI00391BFCDD